MSQRDVLTVEFGDFQTPASLAGQVCQRVKHLGIAPAVIIEPTCGLGAFVTAASLEFPEAKEILGFEINGGYLAALDSGLERSRKDGRIRTFESDFFSENWNRVVDKIDGSILVLGNLPWVTNAEQGRFGGANLPEKSNFQRHNGMDAITGKSNFDVSEWMMIKILEWFRNRPGDVAMLVKTAVARKILAYAERQKIPVYEASIISIDAKKDFDASVDACLLVLRISSAKYTGSHDYLIFESLSDSQGRRVGHRCGMTIADLEKFQSVEFLLGESPQKWRSGIKHDASSIMELSKTPQGLENGFGEAVDLEPDYLFPFMKGSDVASGRDWRQMYLLVTQRFVGEPTSPIQIRAPRTWKYLESHGAYLDKRKSSIYLNRPRFAIFGVGEYAFRPWRIAICGLYKKLAYRLVGPMDGKPIMFDDTVNYVSFESESEAHSVYEKLTSAPAISLISSLVFWDEKRPIKTGILNVLDWSRLDLGSSIQASLF